MSVCQDFAIAYFEDICCPFEQDLINLLDPRTKIFCLATIGLPPSMHRTEYVSSHVQIPLIISSETSHYSYADWHQVLCVN